MVPRQALKSAAKRSGSDSSGHIEIQKMDATRTVSGNDRPAVRGDSNGQEWGLKGIGGDGLTRCQVPNPQGAIG